MTFVLEGTVEHFDTKTNVWTKIQKDGFQKRKTQLQNQNNNIKQSSISIAISLVFCIFISLKQTNYAREHY